jgi:hypothetical protein
MNLSWLNRSALQRRNGCNKEGVEVPEAVWVGAEVGFTVSRWRRP